MQKEDFPNELGYARVNKEYLTPRHEMSYKQKPLLTLS